MSSDDGFEFRLTVLGIGEAENIHFHSRRCQCDDGMHVFGNAGSCVERDGGPHR